MFIQRILLTLCIAWLLPLHVLAQTDPRGAVALKKFIHLHKNSRQKVDSLNALTLLYANAAENDSLLKYSDLTIELASKLTYAAGMARAYTRKAVIFYDQSESEEALKLYREALTLYKTTGNNHNIASTLVSIGNVYINTAEYVTAGKIFYEALAYHEKLKEKTEKTQTTLGAIYTNLGNISFYLQEFAKAEEFYMKAGQTFETGSESGLADIYYNLNLVLKQEKKFAEALHYLKLAYAIQQKKDNAESMAHINTSFFMYYYNIQKFDSCAYYINRTLDLYTKMNSISGTAQAHMNLASLDAETKNFNGAFTHMKEAGTLLKGTRDFFTLTEYEEGYAELCEQTGDLKGTIEHLKQFIAWKDSLFSDSKARSVKEMEEKYQNKKKVLEIENLTQQKALDKAEIARKTTESESESFQKKVFGIALCIGVLIIAYVIYNLRITRRQKRLIEQQKEVVEEQKHIVEEKQKEILDSIHYARRIQRSQLPTIKYIEKNLKKK
jgi:tetratricopeptide (TPR) repeat protein